MTFVTFMVSREGEIAVKGKNEARWASAYVTLKVT
jgi:hypothetical protein